MRCDGCDMQHFPACSGESNPSHCQPGHPTRHKASKFQSSLLGWPRRGGTTPPVAPPEAPPATPIMFRRPPQPESIVVIHGSLTNWTGYGRIATNLGKALERLGIPVRFQSKATDPRYHGLPQFVVDRLVENPPQSWVLRIDVPFALPDDRSYVHFSMWEATGLPRESVERLNQAMAVILPCSWNASCFSAKGVTPPLRLAPIGLDPSEGFTPRPLRTAGPFRFGMAARIAHGGMRKGIADGINAFLEAFPHDDALMDIKIFPDCDFPEPADPRVTLNRTPMTPAMMADWYESIDVLFVPSKGEGWGMHTHEAMACGRPAITSLFGGTADFCDRSTAWPLEYTLEPAREFYDDGHWIVPTMPSMVRTLRQVRSLRGSPEFVAKSDAAAIRAAEFTWDRTARAVRDVLNELGLLATKPRVPLGVPHCVPCQAKTTAAQG